MQQQEQAGAWPADQTYGAGAGAVPPPQQQQQQAQGLGQSPAQGDDTQQLPRNLWIGELQYWMDENYLWNCFAHTNDLQAVKIIRNKVTGQSEGYGFVEFGTNATAIHVLQTYNGAIMPQTEQPFKLNWASFGGGAGQQRQPMGGGGDGGAEFSIFVGDLANDVTDYVLVETFRTHYPSVKSAKVVIDIASGRSKGYGFVRFGSEQERDRALAEMNGQFCSSRPMRISLATPKKAGGPGQGPAQGGQRGGHFQQPQGDDDLANTTIFVGGLDNSVTEDQLRGVFGNYGELVYVKIPLGKGCGFVQYLNRASAEAALTNLHGTQIGSQSVRLSWGRNPSAKQRGGHQAGGLAQDQSQYGGGYYGAGQGSYGYDAAAAYGAADPSAAYGYGYGYGAGYGYGQPQQQWGAQQQAQAGAQMAMPGQQQQQQQQQQHQQQQGAGAGAVGTFATPAPFDPSQPPNVDKMNTQYMAKHETGLLPHHLLLKVSDSITA